MEKNKSSQNLEETNIFFEEFKDKFQVLGYNLIKSTSLDYYRYRTNKKIDKGNKLNFDEWFGKYVMEFKI
tara:strand:- start:228 stop:437 length:210 start_codon:yes stop_codon:yes gene_type:complete